MAWVPAWRVAGGRDTLGEVIVPIIHVITLLAVGGVWLVAWRVGYRLARGCGADNRGIAWVLACIVPTSGLLMATHLVAGVCLLGPWELVTPQAVLVLFVLLTGLAHRYVDRSFPALSCTERIMPTLAPLGRLGWWWWPILVLAATYAVFALDALSRYPTGYDGLTYHLPSAFRWMQQQRLDLIFGVAQPSYPDNGMIVPFLLAFAGLEPLFSFCHLPKAMLLPVVMYELTRALGAGPKACTAAACIAVSVPMVIFQAFSSYVDLYAVVAWLSALLAIIRLSQTTNATQRRGLLILAGLSAGVALGSKLTYTVQFALLAGIVVYAELIRPLANDAARRRPVRSLILFGLAGLACSAFWFVRGAVQAGNPVYPIAVSIGESNLLPGRTTDSFFPHRSPMEKIRRWWSYPWREPKRSGTGYPYGVNNGLGGAYATFVPVGMLAALWGIGRRRTRSPAQRWCAVYAFMSMLGLVLLLTVFFETLRFILPQVMLAIPVAALLVERLGKRYPRVVPLMLTASLGITSMVAALQPLHAFMGRVRNDRWDRAWFYQIPPLLDQLEPGSRVLNLAAAPFTYSLLGANLTNDAINPSQWSQGIAPEGISRETLWQNHIDYVVVREPWPSGWPLDLPLEIVYDEAASRKAGIPATRVYRVNRNVR